MPRNYITQDKIDGEFDFLNAHESNTSLYRDLKSREKSEVNIQKLADHALPFGYELARYDNSDGQFIVVLLNHESEEVAYYIRANVWEDVFLNSKPVTQVLLWRSIRAKHKKATRDLAEHVFFGYLLEQYNVVASDSHQTVQGRTFWETKLSMALDIGLFVYRYHRINCDIKKVTTDEEISSNSCDLWGDDEDYQNVLAIISKSELPLT